MSWTLLGSGAYNDVYLSSDRKTVLKIQKIKHNPTDAYDTPERSVKLWNYLNPDIAGAEVVMTKFGKGWTCPYIEGEQASDEEISTALIDIYNKTGRIVIDAPSKKNFIKTPAGRVVCVDVGMAIQFERREDIELPEGRGRRKSIISLDSWETSYHDHAKYIDHYLIHRPLVAQTILLLIIIKELRPDLYDLSILCGNHRLIRDLLNFFHSATIDNFLAKLNTEIAAYVEASALAKTRLVSTLAPLKPDVPPTMTAGSTGMWSTATKPGGVAFFSATDDDDRDSLCLSMSTRSLDSRASSPDLAGLNIVAGTEAVEAEGLRPEEGGAKITTV